ncbi:MAG: class I SAM-dependent methyltransferase [Candidatus Nucleicultricaceae bacterium]
MPYNPIRVNDTPSQTVQQRILDNDFYTPIRKEITNERLTYLENASKKLDLPGIFGQFSSESHYLKTVDLFIKATEETRNRGIFFLRNVLPHLKTSNSLLDIGPGNGKLTRWIGRKFKEITLVDPVPEVLENISEVSFPKGSLLKKINKSFLETILPQNAFDLIVLSHVMYHFPQEKWIDVIEKALKSLQPNGIIVVVINSGLDREKLGDLFNGKTFPVLNLAHAIEELGKDVEFISSKESFYAQDLTTMLHICGLHLHDTGGCASREDLEKHIQSNYLLTNHDYKMSVYQHFIIIRHEADINLT